MRSRMKLAAASVVAVTVLPVAGAATAQADAASAATVLQAGVNKGVADGYPGVIGMIRDGSTVQYVSAGYGDTATKTAADPQAQFRIGSLTKAFTSTVVLQLEAEGKLSLDDTVEKWLPGVVDSNGYDGSKITIRELLNQTSGLPDYFSGVFGTAYFANLYPDAAYTPQSLVATGLASRAPVSTPGTTWAYSNTNYVLAGMIIQKVTGSTPGAEITDRIITPLGLTDTTFPTTNQLTGDYLHGYNLYWGFDGTVSNIDMTGAAGAIVSTLPNLSTFVQSLLDGKLLPAKQLAELETVVPEPGTNGVASYGLGIASQKLPCGKTAWLHDGGVLGYRSYWLSNADGTQQVLLAANEFHGNESTQGQTDTQTALVNAYCAL